MVLIMCACVMGEDGDLQFGVPIMFLHVPTQGTHVPLWTTVQPATSTLT